MSYVLPANFSLVVARYFKKTQVSTSFIGTKVPYLLYNVELPTYKLNTL